ncbi:MAG: OadG family protein [Planctomycetota bacterium]
MPLTLAQNNLTEALVLTGVGMGVVFAALLLLMVMIMGLHRALGDRARPTPAVTRTPAKPQPKTGTPQADASDMSDELIAVLTAAAAAVLGRPASAVRVLRFQRSNDDWAAAGRGSLTRSHQPTRTPTSTPPPLSPPASPRSRRL